MNPVLAWWMFWNVVLGDVVDFGYRRPERSEAKRDSE